MEFSSMIDNMFSCARLCLGTISFPYRYKCRGESQWFPIADKKNVQFGMRKLLDGPEHLQNGGRCEIS
jgi:hypothetical protein